MELLVREETFEFMDTVCSAVFTAEAETEKIIPDALDDVVEVVCTDAVLLLRGKEVSGGKVSVAGAADICVICRTESGVVSSLQVELPFTVSGDAPMATENSAITADLSLVSCGVHLINPRKLTVKITAAADVSCFEKQRLTVPVGITGLDDIETLSKTVETVTAADAFEKVFAVNEDFTLPSVKPELA